MPSSLYFLLFAFVAVFGGVPSYAQCNLSASSSGFNAAYTQEYVLTDSYGVIIATNGTGSFSAPTDGVYHVHALNYDPSDPPSPLPSALVGQPLSQVGSTTAGCYNSDFETDFVTRICASCTLTATSSGFTPAFVQVYVLVDEAGNIVASNATGTFAVSTAGTFYVHALNYDPSDPPSPLPAALVGQPLSQVGSTTAGCYNSDLLTDFVTRSCSECYQERTACIEDNFIVSTSGQNGAYAQLYVLTNPDGNILSTSLTGDFTGQISVGQNYRIYALNYDPSAPPTPLPVVGAQIANVGHTTAGCRNTDFLTDYLCYQAISCLLPLRWLSFEAECREEGVVLTWETADEKNNAFFTVEKSKNGEDWEVLGRVSTKKVLQAENFYRFVWPERPAQRLYFRVRQTDYDGKFTFTPVQTVHCGLEEKDLQVFPNPTQSILNISGLQAGEYIYLQNLLGETLQKTRVTKSNYTLRLEGLPVGLYLLVVEGAQRKVCRRVVKE